MPPLQCPLCYSYATALYHQDSQREYHRCQHCDLRFIPPQQCLSPSVEKAEYDRHQNHPADPNYRRFLGRLFSELRPRLNIHDRGLDFGCGPGPTLSRMFAESGLPMALYDLYYTPDHQILEQCYDFITATEVVEHLQQPGRELNRLWQQLTPGGHLGIMTKLARDHAAFSRWHYLRDPTHVVFFSRHSFQWLAQRWRAHLEFIGQDVILLTRSDSP